MDEILRFLGMSEDVIRAFQDNNVSIRFHIMHNQIIMVLGLRCVCFPRNAKPKLSASFHECGEFTRTIPFPDKNIFPSFYS